MKIKCVKYYNVKKIYINMSNGYCMFVSLILFNFSSLCNGQTGTMDVNLCVFIPDVRISYVFIALIQYKHTRTSYTDKYAMIW